MPRATKKQARSLYSIHPGVAMVQKWIRELPEKTGRTLEEWLDFIKTEGPPTEKEQREWLKKEFGMGTTTAWWLAERASGNPMGLAEEDPEEYLLMAEQYVDGMFAGPRATLRPVYDRLLDLGLGIGSEVKACPCKTIVPLYRNHVFAEIKPATRTRIDLGFALGDMKPVGRLLDTGGFQKKNRITHRIPITNLAEIDDEVTRWLQTAYERDG